MTRAELNNLFNRADIGDDEYIVFGTPNGAEFGGVSDVLEDGNRKIVLLCGSQSDNNLCAKPPSVINPRTMTVVRSLFFARVLRYPLNGYSQMK